MPNQSILPSTMKKGMFKFSNLIALTACFGLMCLVAIRRDGMLFGQRDTDKQLPVESVVSTPTPQIPATGASYSEAANTKGTDSATELNNKAKENNKPVKENTKSKSGVKDESTKPQKSETAKIVRKIVPVTDTVITSSQSGIEGYNGPVPVQVTIKDGKVASVTALDNDETPGFFRKVENGGLLNSWNGKSVAEAASMKVDGISGATYSSEAVIANVTAALQTAAAGKTVFVKEEDSNAGASSEKSADKKVSEKNASATPDTQEDTLTDSTPTAKIEPQPTAIVKQVKRIHTPRKPEFTPTWQWIISLAVVCCGLILPLFLKKRWYRNLQLVLNVAVLGFLTGTFLSYSLMVRFLSHGIGDWVMSLVALIMLAAAFLMPFLGRKNHYCMWICPLGSAQELMGKMVKKKPRIGKKTVKVLTRIRELLWCVLMVAMWMGAWYEWMDYEPFGCFMVKEASAAVIATGAVILVLSIVIDRPYCRFVCPTGTLFKMAQK